MYWDADEYIRAHRFITKYGEALLNDVPDCDAILDIGCGTGELTKLLGRKATFVRGIDQSETMIQRAKAQFPTLDISVADILHYQDAHRYDVAFANAVFHWIDPKAQPRLLGKIAQLLKRRGLLVTEFGGAYNVEVIRKAFQAALHTYHAQSKLRFYFPEPKAYQKLLHRQGFIIHKLNHDYRPTPLQNGYHGLPTWLHQFFETDLKRFTPTQQADIIQRTCDKAMPQIWDGTSWIADYWRLQVVAEKKTK